MFSEGGFKFEVVQPGVQLTRAGCRGLFRSSSWQTASGDSPHLRPDGLEGGAMEKREGIAEAKQHSGRPVCSCQPVIYFGISAVKAWLQGMLFLKNLLHLIMGQTTFSPRITSR